MIYFRHCFFWTLFENNQNDFERGRMKTLIRVGGLLICMLGASFQILADGPAPQKPVGPVGGAPGKHPDGYIFQILDKLDLSKEQKGKIDKLRLTYNGKEDAKVAVLRPATDEFRKMLTQDPLAKREVAKKQHEAVVKLMDEIAEIRFNMQYEIAAILNGKQRIQLNDLINKGRSMPMNRMMPRNMPGPVQTPPNK